MRLSVARSTSALTDFLRVTRVIVSCLPINTVYTRFFDFLFTYLSAKLENKDTYYHGAYAILGVTPAILVANSPLLAKISNGYSFPGHPVSVRRLTFHLYNTATFQERNGRWAAVFIPYREPKDVIHIPKQLKSMEFSEVASMPYAKVSPAHRPITLSYWMRNRSDYCARPRDLDSTIGALLVFWDTTRSSSMSKTAPTNDEFSCEIKCDAVISPHVIFGPQHRITYPDDDFKVKNVETAAVRLKDGDNFHFFSSVEECEKFACDEEFEDLSVDKLSVT